MRIVDTTSNEIIKNIAVLAFLVLQLVKRDYKNPTKGKDKIMFPVSEKYFIKVDLNCGECDGCYEIEKIYLFSQDNMNDYQFILMVYTDKSFEHNIYNFGNFYGWCIISNRHMLEIIKDGRTIVDNYLDLSEEEKFFHSLSNSTEIPNMLELIIKSSIWDLFYYIDTDISKINLNLNLGAFDKVIDALRKVNLLSESINKDCNQRENMIEYINTKYNNVYKE